jgi:hypothetical protein
MEGFDSGGPQNSGERKVVTTGISTRLLLDAIAQHVPGAGTNARLQITAKAHACRECYHNDRTKQEHNCTDVSYERCLRRATLPLHFLAFWEAEPADPIGLSLATICSLLVSGTSAAHSLREFRRKHGKRLGSGARASFTEIEGFDR